MRFCFVCKKRLAAATARGALRLQGTRLLCYGKLGRVGSVRALSTASLCIPTLAIVDPKPLLLMYIKILNGKAAILDHLVFVALRGVFDQNLQKR